MVTRAIKRKDAENQVNDGDKAWVTVSMNINLGNFENVKVESGFSQTLQTGDDPVEIMQGMQERIGPVVLAYAESLERTLTKPLKRK